MIRYTKRLLPMLAMLLAACTADSQNHGTADKAFAQLPGSQDTRGLKTATLAGGCFWCVEAVFERVKGVKYVVSGYAGGTKPDPTYEEVGRGETRHAESVQIYYDPDTVGFGTLLDVFFGAAHDPTQVNGQGPDIGPQYRSIAFYRTAEEKQEIESKIKTWENNGTYDKPIATEVEKFTVFYPAEKYHQGYYDTHPDNPYVQNVSRPKVKKFEKRFPNLVKAQYR